MTQFDVRMRGYDIDQVDQTINTLQQQLDQLTRKTSEQAQTITTVQTRAKSLQARLSDVTSQLETTRDDLQKLNTAYQNAEEKANKPVNYKTLGDAAQQFIEDAQANAKSIVNTAQAKADELRQSSEQYAEKTVSDAKQQAAQGLEEARKRASQQVDNAKSEAARIVDTARQQADTMVKVATVKADEQQKRAEHYLKLIADIRDRVTNVGQLIDVESTDFDPTPARHRQQVKGFDFKTNGVEQAQAKPDDAGEETVMMQPVHDQPSALPASHE